MADLSITSANFVIDQTLPYLVDTQYYAGATLAAGQMVYRDASDSNKIKLADANGTSAVADAHGLAAAAASTGQPVIILRKGTFTVGATVAVGTRYVLSATAGGVCPEADLVTNDYVTNAFEPISTTKAYCDFTRTGNSTGVQHA